MATESTTNTTTIIARADQHDIDLHKASDRVNFGSIKEPIDVPYLLGVQTDSFDWLIGSDRWKKRVEEDEANGTNTVAHTSGLDEVFNEISPIENFAQTMSPDLLGPVLRGAAPHRAGVQGEGLHLLRSLYVNAEFENGDTGESSPRPCSAGDFRCRPRTVPSSSAAPSESSSPSSCVPGRLLRPAGSHFRREVPGAKIILSRGAWPGVRNRQEGPAAGARGPQAQAVRHRVPYGPSA